MANSAPLFHDLCLVLQLISVNGAELQFHIQPAGKAGGHESWKPQKNTLLASIAPFNLMGTFIIYVGSFPGAYAKRTSEVMCVPSLRLTE